MKLAVLGLSEREEFIFDLFLKRHLNDWQWVRGHTNDPRREKPDMVIVDLAALGWGQYSPQAHQQLKHTLADLHALLLVSANDRTWSEITTGAEQNHWGWLAKPYNAESMRDALLRSAASVSQHRKMAALPQTDPTTHQPTLLNALIEPPAPMVLTVTELAAKLAHLARTQCVLLHSLSHELAKGLPFELRFTVQNSLIVHPQDAWVATNTPMQVIHRVSNSDTLAASLSCRAIESNQAQERAQRLGMTFQELDVFLYDIVAATQCLAAPQPAQPLP